MSLFYKYISGLLTILCILKFQDGFATSNDSTNTSRIISGDFPSWFIGAKFYGGYTFSPYERIKNLEAHTLDFELIVSKATFGDKTWQQVHAYPRLGLAINYINLGKPEITGNVLAIIPHLQWHLIGQNASVLGIRFGAGIGYFNSTFDPLHNYRDKAISTPINVCLQLNAIYTQKINKYLELNSGLGVTHFSNGSWKLPNAGFNIPAIFIGGNYILHQNETLVHQSAEELAVKKPYYFYAYSSISFETQGFNGENHYTIYSLSACVGKQLARRSKVGIGFDVFYDPTIVTDSAGAITSAKHPTDNLQAGIKIEHELVIGNLGLITNWGVYILHPANEYGPFYQILGVKYNLNPNFFVGTFLKTHYFTADFIQLALGYSF